MLENTKAKKKNLVQPDQLTSNVITINHAIIYNNNLIPMGVVDSMNYKCEIGRQNNNRSV